MFKDLENSGPLAFGNSFGKVKPLPRRPAGARRAVKERALRPRYSCLRFREPGVGCEIIRSRYIDKPGRATLDSGAAK